MPRHPGNPETKPRFVPPAECWPLAGVYQLRLELSRAVRVNLGARGRWTLPPGQYVYTGRARRGLLARVRRHVAGAVRRHWHIDHLLARGGVRIVAVVLADGDATRECAVNQATVGQIPVPGFGASDCQAGCGAHLKHVTPGAPGQGHTQA